MIRAGLDPLRKGHDLKGLLVCGGYLFSAASYALLMLPTYGFITGAGSTTQKGAQTQQSMASVMSQRWGPWVIGLLQIYQGFNNSNDKQYQTYAMTPQEVKWATQLGRLGTATRGIILVLVGGAVFLAAYQSNSSQAIGIDAALTTLKQQPYGVWLLGIVALGLIAFGVYSMLSEAWFRSKR